VLGKISNGWMTIYRPNISAALRSRDELLEPKSKRVCSRREKKVDDNDPSVKVLSGIIFIKLRRDLSWKYYKYKKQLKDTDAPYVSKDE
jgi:hypothetical protein